MKQDNDCLDLFECRSLSVRRQLNLSCHCLPEERLCFSYSEIDEIFLLEAETLDRLWFPEPLLLLRLYQPALFVLWEILVPCVVHRLRRLLMSFHIV